MNSELEKLHPYPFERLLALKDSVEAPAALSPIALSIGEPKHPAPAFVAQRLSESLDGLSRYPFTRGEQALRETIVDWLGQRFKLPANSLDAQRHILPVSGTREALFAFAQATFDRARGGYVLMPNPFYQIYEGAALLAGAEPYYLNTPASHGYLPDFDAVSEQTWARCQLLYLCSPGNPTGAVIDSARLQQLIALAEKHNFIIASDECYSEIYADESMPPVGLLQAAAQAGYDDYRRCVVFHSLSKRSNLPGLRSGFVAGDEKIIADFLKYRTYHGCAMPHHHQSASIAAWQDEAHVEHNRHLYRAKFDAVLAILPAELGLTRPAAGFYLWPQTPINDVEFTRGLYAQQNVTVLPGSFLSRPTRDGDPGENRVRLALVAELEECISAAKRIRSFIESLS